MKLLLKKGKIFDPVNNLSGEYDILIENRVVSKISKNIREKDSKDVEIYDLNGLYILPGLIDMHVHLREPGYEEKETIKTGCEAAAAGGFTTIACMPNTKPVADNPATVEYIKAKAEKALVNVVPVGSITKNGEGKELAEIGFLKEAGVRALSDDGNPVMNSEIMRRAMEYAASFMLPIISHCEDKNLSGDGVMNEGYYSTILGLKPIPTVAEEIMIARDILLAEYTGASLHIAHLSTERGLELVLDAKRRGINVSCEVTPHHLLFDDSYVTGYDPDTKVNPPLRDKRDVTALREGVKMGIVDVIATDHAPHTYEDKLGEYDYAAFGISGLETAVSSLYTELILKELFDFNDLVRLMGINPARILKLDYPGIRVGTRADLIVFDPGRNWKVEKETLKSKGKNTPLLGKELKGKVVLTFVKGKMVYNDLENKGVLIYE
jgi:dihydroorotase